MTTHAINRYLTYSAMQVLAAERIDHTFQNAIWKSFSLNGINVLSMLVMNYNQRKHHIIRV
jgi:hypothetical protein